MYTIESREMKKMEVVLPAHLAEKIEALVLYHQQVYPHGIVTPSILMEKMIEEALTTSPMLEDWRRTQKQPSAPPAAQRGRQKKSRSTPSAQGPAPSTSSGRSASGSASTAAPQSTPATAPTPPTSTSTAPTASASSASPRVEASGQAGEPSTKSKLDAELEKTRAARLSTAGSTST